MNKENPLLKEEKADNVIEMNPKPKFDVLPGGKDPTVNWLAELPQGTVFLCRKRNVPAGQVQLFMDEWTLDNNTFKHFKLHDDLNPQIAERFVWVNPREFSMLHELVEVLEEGKQ